MSTACKGAVSAQNLQPRRRRRCPADRLQVLARRCALLSRPGEDRVMIRVARAMLVALLTVAGGCSGGSHDTDDGATGGEPPSPPPPPTGGVTLTLTAHDAFGTP